MNSHKRKQAPARFWALLLLAAFLWAGMTAPAAAAGMAEDHTVLYYLIEMQRRYKKSCGGAAMPEAPSLVPSEALRAVAAQGTASSSLGGVPHAALNAYGQTPQQAFDALMVNQCSSLMGRDYRYIGASRNGGQWSVILAAAEPGRAGAPGDGATAGTQFRAPEADGYAAEMPSPSSPSPAGGTPDKGKPKSGWIDGGEVRFSADRLNEAAPADPVVVGEMQVDAAGRPYGPVLPPSGAYEPAPPAAPLDTGVAPGLTPPAALGSPSGGGFGGGGGQPWSGDASGTAETGVPPQDGPAPFVPPQSPGPYGGRSAAAPGAVPASGGGESLQDTRAAKPDGSLSYVAPQGGAESTAGTVEVRPSASGPGAAYASGRSGADMDARMLVLVNELRARGATCGSDYMGPAPALAHNSLLMDRAAAHARDMTARRYFSSTTPEGGTLGRRLSDAGYDWGFVAENIASLNGSPEQVLQSWLAVPAQCSNLMGPEYQDAGLGYDPSGNHWVFTLATPLDAGAIRLR